MKKIIEQRENGTTRIRVVNEEPSMVQRHFKETTDINKIMRKYHNDMRQVAPPQRGFYGEFSNAPDYLAARISLIEAQQSFDALPSEVRKRFGNDPAQLLAFIDDKNNRDEAIKLGLIDPPPPAPPELPPNPHPNETKK